MVGREPESRLREVVHQRVRLGVLAVLDRQGSCTFTQLRDALNQSDGALSRHLGVLEEHGYITTEKVFENRRPRTWVHPTAAGTEAFREEQELLAKLLARVMPDSGATTRRSGEQDERAAAMTIVFAALLADEDAGSRDRDGTRSGTDPVDRSTLVPAAPVLLAGQRARPVASGPISSRYDFPADYADYGQEQREQRMMMLSHGLRGGWISTWSHGDDEQPGDEQTDGITAHAMVVELGAPPDCEAILAIMGPPTVSLPDEPAVRGYLLPGHDKGSPTTAVAWFSNGPYLASVVILASTEIAVPALENLVDEVQAALAHHRP